MMEKSRMELTPLLKWVIRVEIAMSALLSAVHITRFCHVQPMCDHFAPSCTRSANNKLNRGTCVQASIDLAGVTRLRFVAQGYRSIRREGKRPFQRARAPLSRWR
jgi:hypothetical protein